MSAMFVPRPFSEQRLTAVARYSVRCVAVHYSKHLNYWSLAAHQLACRHVGGTHHCSAFEWLSVFVTFMPHFVKIGQVIYTDTKRGHLLDLPFLRERWLGWYRILVGVWGMSLRTLSWARELSQDVPTVVSLLCDRAAELGEGIKESPCT